MASLALNTSGWFEPSPIRINYFAMLGRIKSIKWRKPRGNNNNISKAEVRE